MKVDYTKSETPDDYKCAHCGATGCKLWSRINDKPPQLIRANCATLELNEKVIDLDADGMINNNRGGRTNSLMWHHPAIPNENGSGYWRCEFTSIPLTTREWWRKLPSRPRP